MTDQERLQLIIKTALKHGFTRWQDYEATDDGDFIVVKESWRYANPPTVPVERILYGDNLSLLKAAFDDRRVMFTSYFETDGYDELEDDYRYNGGIYGSI